jgi:hypothetical protein
MTQSVVRREGMSQWRFVRDYLWTNRPVVVTAALKDWVGLTKWNTAFFQSKLGHEPVCLQGDTFNPTRTISFAEFLETVATYEELPASAPQFLEELSYVRRRSWSETQQTTLHTLIEKDWSRPNFLPSSMYLWPRDLLSSSPNLHRYPAFGVYISPRGAVTGLHVDPKRSSAVLCQIGGKKQGFLFPPGNTNPMQNKMLTSAPARRARKIDVLHGRSPDYHGMKAIRFDLQPGEVLYIPMGWAHEVFTTSTSISLTYNFIHFWGLRHKYSLKMRAAIEQHFKKQPTSKSKKPKRTCAPSGDNRDS